MAKIKVAEASSLALDWMVAKCAGLNAKLSSTGFLIYSNKSVPTGPNGRVFQPSSAWAQGGLIIDLEGIGFYKANESKWWAHPYGGEYNAEGKTALIAAMRCYVTSKLGDEVEVPDELLET